MPYILAPDASLPFDLFVGAVPRAAPDHARNRRGVPAPSRDERRSHHSFVLIGVASAVAVVAALVLIVVAHSDGPAELPVDRIVTEVAPAEGPGSNSLNLTAPDASVTDAQHTDVSLSRAAEGPGSNSLNVTEP